MINPDYSNLNKVRIGNPCKSFLKHEIIKLILTCLILEKHKKEKLYCHVYTELPIVNGERTKKTDLLFLDIRKKSAYSFEIQKKIDDSWNKEINEFYKDWDYPMMNNSDLIIIKLKDLSDDIPTLIKQLEEFII